MRISTIKPNAEGPTGSVKFLSAEAIGVRETQSDDGTYEPRQA